jgi:hypothetical protein
MRANSHIDVNARDETILAQMRYILCEDKRHIVLLLMIPERLDRGGDGVVSVPCGACVHEDTGRRGEGHGG